MSRALVLPEVIESSTLTGRWMVVIFNNDYTPMDDVVAILMKATGCSMDEAFIEMWEAHHFGKASVHFAERTECEIVAAMIATVGVKTVVRPEWDD